MKRHAGLASLAVLCAVVCGVSCSSDDAPPSKQGASGGANTGGASDGGTAGAKAEPLELVTHHPAAGDENAWALRPIELEFSTPLDKKSLRGAFRLQLAGADLEHEVTVDSTGKRVTLTLNELPTLPAKLSLSVAPTLRSAGGDEFAGDSWSFTYPLWQSPRGELPHAVGEADGLALGVLPDRSVIVIAARENGRLQAVHQSNDGWEALAQPPVVSGHARPVEARVDSKGRVIALWVELDDDTETAYAARYADDKWTLLGDSGIFVGADLRPSLALDGDTPVVAARSAAGAVAVRRFSTEGWERVGTTFAGAGGTLRELDLTLNESGQPVVAIVDAAYDVVVAEWDGSAWAPLGKLDRARTSGAAEPSIAWTDDGPVVAYLDGDEVSTNVQVARRKSQWEPLGAALDVELDAQASQARLELDPSGVPVVLWRERWGSSDRFLAARWHGEGWRVLGAALGHLETNDVRSPRLAFDEDGHVHAAWLSGDTKDAIEVRRFNGSPTLPRGIVSRGDRGDCAIPEDTADNFPTTLSATGCYEDLRKRSLVSAAIPFSVNSALWSDGALKKRYVLLPENGTAEYVADGPFVLPVGTLLIKEFYLEKTQGDPATSFPVETRFLVKRLADDTHPESWQGYSYRWNAAGTEGVLLDGMDSETHDWAVTSAAGQAVTHTHSYPSRFECTQCHNAAGRSLGLYSAQLNRPGDFGDVIDNQLRAWMEAGLFGVTAPDEPAESLERLASPPDVGRSLEERTLSYFHSNCSHCHRPGGISTPTPVDFRYFAPLASNNICNHIVPGSHETSQIWLNDAHRGPAVGVTKQMPPLATLLLDNRQLAVTAAWIDSEESCP